MFHSKDLIHRDAIWTLLWREEREVVVQDVSNNSEIYIE